MAYCSWAQADARSKAAFTSWACAEVYEVWDVVTSMIVPRPAW